MSQTDSNTVADRFYHCTKADPKLGGSIIVGSRSNFATEQNLCRGAIPLAHLMPQPWGAERASGKGR